MRLRRTVLPGALLLMLAFVTGCPKPPPVEGWVTGQPLALDDARALEIAGAHREHARHNVALRGTARVVIEGADFKLNRPQRIALERPERFRFEVLGLFDVLAAMLVSDGVEFGFFDAGTGEIRRGPVTPALLWELAQLDLEAGEAVELLLGTPTPPEAMALSGVWLENDAGITMVYAPLSARHRARCEARGFTLCTGSLEDLDRGGEIFRFDAQGRLREVQSLDPGRVTRYRAFFEDYRDQPLEADATRVFPMRITVHSPQVEALARFEWKRVMLTDTLPDRLFVIPRDTQSGG